MSNKRIECIIKRAVRCVTVLTLVMVAFAGSPAWSESSGRCAWVEVPWPTTLPDGSMHEAGAIKLCLQQMWTPASGLHEIQINGASFGLFMSRVGRNEGRIEDVPMVVFQKNATGQHHLIGYAWPDGDAMRTYVLHQSGKASSTMARSKRKKRLPLFETEDHEIVAALIR